jgi:hypothetical protein
VRAAVLYSALILLSLAECLAGCAAEVISSNIAHLKNGRRANASCSLFPTIPVLPAAYALLAFGLNLVAPSLGYVVVGMYGVLSTGWKYWHYRKRLPTFKVLLAQETVAT